MVNWGSGLFRVVSLEKASRREVKEKLAQFPANEVSYHQTRSSTLINLRIGGQQQYRAHAFKRSSLPWTFLKVECETRTDRHF